VSDSVSVRMIAPAAATTGEGPFWSPDQQMLHWVDIPAGRIHTTDPATGATDTVTVPTWVGAAIPRADGFVAATREGFAAVVDGQLDTRVRVLGDGQRSNDAKCDRSGRLWAGTNAMDFAAGAGALRVLEPDWTTRVVLDGLTLPNGMGWSPDDATFYFIDTFQHVLWAFDFDLDSGSVRNRRVLHHFGAPIQPDGMCVDAEGGLWIAIWGGARIVNLDPSGAEVRTIAVPVRQPSSCAFGGPDLATLYVTSARDGLELADDAPDGSVFAITGLGVTGLPVSGFAG
jgi:sugar lactone lactonase YvrE